MRACAWLLWLAMSCGVAAAQEIDLDQLATAANQWARENLDEDFLAALKQGDAARAHKFIDRFQTNLQSEYVLDLAGLKEGARQLLPLLNSYEETAPYGAWLAARIDMLEVADTLKKQMPPPKAREGEPPPKAPNPSASMERRVWKEEVSQKPWPAEAKIFVPRLKPVFIEQKVPPELVWVAEVESSFNRKAKSPAGAAGLFQLMPETAKQYGLSRWPWDERYNPEDNARAAAKHMAYLHGKFKDWRLALAAYNAGEGRVGKAMGTRKAASFDDICGKLPAETQMYVPRIEAVLLSREGKRLDQL